MKRKLVLVSMLVLMLLMLVPFEALAQSIVDGAVQSSQQTPLLRRSFHTEGRYWEFYKDAGQTSFSSSTDGITWSAATNLATTTYYSIHFDGTYVHLVRTYNSGSGAQYLYYKMGDPNSNGTITWGTEYVIGSFGSNYNQFWSPTVTLDGNGYPYIGWAEYEFHYMCSGTCNYWYAPYHVAKSSTKDGIWTTEWNTVVSGAHAKAKGIVIGLTGGKIAAFYQSGEYGGAISCRRWIPGNPGAWGSEISTVYSASASQFEGYYSAIGQNDDVHIAALKTTTYDIFYTKYSYSTNLFSAETTIYSAATSKSAPAMSRDNANNLHVFWENDPTDDHMYYAKYIYDESTWVSYYDLITEIDLLPANGSYLNTDYTCDESRVGVYYIAGTTILKFKLLGEVFHIHTNSASPVGTTSATLRGEIISQGFGSADTRGFLYNDTPSDVGATDWHEDGTFGVGVFTHGLIGLDTGQNYYYVAYATNDWGTTYGLWVQFTTGGGSSSFVVTTSAPTDVLGTTAVLNAEILGIPPGGNCTKEGFEWGKTVGTMTTWQGNGTFSLGVYTHAITGLEEGKLYYVRAFIGNSTETAYGDYVGFFSSYSSGNANYYSDIVVREICGNSYTQLPVIASVDNTYLVANHFMKASALDTDIQISGIHTPYLPTDDKVVFIVPYIGPYEVVTATYLLGFTPEQAYFNVLVGGDGNVTMADLTGLELGDTDFEVKLRGYIDTDYTPNKNLVYKENAFKLYISADGNITAEGNFTTGLKTITASSISSDTYTIGVTCNGVNMKLYVDGVEKGNVTTGGGNITDNGNSWYLMTGNSTPNLEYYKHSVDSILIAQYQPNTIIDGIVLPDLAGNVTRNGAINWGNNTACITVTVGPLTPLTPPIVVSTDLVPPDVVGVINPPEPVDSTSVGIDVPLLYGIFDWGANVMGIPIMFLWSALAAIVSIAVGIGTAKLTKDERGEPSIPITAIAVGFALGAMSAIGGGIVGIWFIIVYLFIAVPTVMLHSKFSMG